MNSEAGDLVVKGLEGENADETWDNVKVKVTELKGTLFKNIGAKRDSEDWDKEEERKRRKRRLESIQLDWE